MSVRASQHEGDTIRVLAVGDVIGNPGRRTVRRLLPRLRASLQIDLVILNAENSAGGHGVTVKTARELRDAGADVLTSGNHVWSQPDIDEALGDDDLRLLRPINYPTDTPGLGLCTLPIHNTELTVVSLQGRVFMPQNLEDPFRAIDQVIADLNAGSDQPHTRSLLVVDFHAEATAEKQAMGWHVAGRASALFGTHTHVPTADQRILPGDTGYVTDLGMVGPLDSVIGAPIDSSVRRFITQRPARGKVPEGPVTFNAVLFVLDRVRGTCLAIERLDRIDGNSGADRTHA